MLISTVFTNAMEDYDPNAFGGDYIIGGSAAKSDSLPFILSYNFYVR